MHINHLNEGLHFSVLFSALNFFHPIPLPQLPDDILAFLLPLDFSTHSLK